MHTALIRSLTVNFVCLGIGVLFFVFYPRDSGFTITTMRGTRFVSGGAFFAAAIVGLSDLLIGVTLCYSLWRGR